MSQKGSIIPSNEGCFTLTQPLNAATSQIVAKGCKIKVKRDVK